MPRGNDEVFCLAYYSRSLLPACEPERSNELLRILETARRNNAKRDLTGALLVGPDCFVQVLEGPTGAVQDTFSRILRDARHEQLALLHMGVVDRRRFGDWTMSLVPILGLPGSAGGGCPGPGGEITMELLLAFLVDLLLLRLGRRAPQRQGVRPHEATA
jgi:hypothetical protein